MEIEQGDKGLEGYRAWRIGENVKGEPFLSPIWHGKVWIPGENVSSPVLSPEEFVFEKEKSGLYSVANPDYLAKEKYYQPGTNIISGAILPYGSVVPQGEGVTRSQKAMVKELHSGNERCCMCGREPTVYGDNYGCERAAFALYCDECASKRLSHGTRCVKLHKLREKLSNKYNVPLVSSPSIRKLGQT